MAYHTKLTGTRETKYNWLMAHSALAVPLTPIHLRPPFFLFKPVDASIGDEYLPWPSIPELLNQNGDPAPGIVTTHDEFAISWTREEQVEKVHRFLATTDEAKARGQFRLCSQSQWNYARAKKALATGAWLERLVPVLYRPFDTRWTVYDSNVAVHRRERVTGHLLTRR